MCGDWFSIKARTCKNGTPFESAGFATYCWFSSGLTRASGDWFEFWKSWKNKFGYTDPLNKNKKYTNNQSLCLAFVFFSCNIRILHECQVWIDKSVPRVTFWHHEARRVMPNCDPRDRFVYPYLTRIMDSFSCSP